MAGSEEPDAPAVEAGAAPAPLSEEVCPPPAAREGAAGWVSPSLRAARRLRAPGDPARSERNLFSMVWAAAPPLDVEILGRTLFHTALVGLAAGLFGAAFFAGLEYAQRFFLDSLAGFSPLRAHGERIVREAVSSH